MEQVRAAVSRAAAVKKEATAAAMETAGARRPPHPAVKKMAGRVIIVHPACTEEAMEAMEEEVEAQEAQNPAAAAKMEETAVDPETVHNQLLRAVRKVAKEDMEGMVDMAAMGMTRKSATFMSAVHMHLVGAVDILL
jgi:hypothetical protein